MDKKRLCYIIRSRYPKIFGIRKGLQRLKIKRLYRCCLSEKEIEECEKHPSKKIEIIIPYLAKWEGYLRPAVKEMEDILEKAPIYKDRQDKDYLRTDMLFCRLAYGFIPSEYVGFELENKSPEQRKEFVSDIDTNVFGYSVNDIKELQSILDKGDGYLRFSNYFKRDAIVIRKKSDYVQFHEFVQKHPIFVKKVVFSSMGKGVELVNINEVEENEKDYFEKLVLTGKYLLEEKVCQHEEMAKFNTSSVNTIRCITFKTNNGVETPYAFMRVGREGSFVDNGGAGGILIGIDVKTGILDTDGYDEYDNKYSSHPDTKVDFKGSQIPAWEELVYLCKEAASKVKDISYLSWDLAYTEKGWIVIEVNEVGQFIGPQIVMKRGIKKELEESLSRMKKVI